MAREASRLRRQLAERDLVTSVGAHDAMTAMLAEEAGADLVTVGGYHVSLATLGLPDTGYITMPEMVENCRPIAASVDVPVIGDFDHGYGNALNARRAIEEAIRHTELAGVIVEDQQAPKRCGHVAGKQLVSREAAAGKFRAACDLRDDLDEEFVVVGRTDAVGAVGGGIDEAIARAKAYVDAGVDVAFVEGPTSIAQVERVGRELGEEYGASVFYNNLTAGDTDLPMVDRETLAGMGYDISHFTASLVPTMVSVYDHYEGLLADGVDHERAFHERTADHPVGSLHEFSGFEEVYELEREYLPEEDREKYEQSVGYDPTGG